MKMASPGNEHLKKIDFMHNKLHEKTFKDLLEQWVSCDQQKKLIT